MIVTFGLLASALDKRVKELHLHHWFVMFSVALLFGIRTRWCVLLYAVALGAMFQGFAVYGDGMNWMSLTTYYRPNGALLRFQNRAMMPQVTIKVKEPAKEKFYKEGEPTYLVLYSIPDGYEPTDFLDVSGPPNSFRFDNFDD